MTPQQQSKLIEYFKRNFDGIEPTEHELEGIEDIFLWQKKFVCSRYPDACARAYSSNAICIWTPMLNKRLSGFFFTTDRAWEDAVEWIKRADNKSLNK